MMNRTILIGRLTRDPELKQTQSGVSVVTFTIAVKRAFVDADGNREADYIQCVVWRNQAENLAKYMRKGSMIGIEGRIQTRNYEKDEGLVFVTEVVCDSVTFLESKKEETNYQEDAPFEDVKPKRSSKEDLPF